MKINICPELWEKYLGKWNFSIFLDYCLEIKRNRKSISIDIFDILRDEKCVLIPIKLSDEYLSFWMRSSWTNIKFSIFQHLKNVCRKTNGYILTACLLKNMHPSFVRRR